MISPVTIEMDLSVKNHVSVSKQNFLKIFCIYLFYLNKLMGELEKKTVNNTVEEITLFGH